VKVLRDTDVSLGRVNENLGPIGYRTLLLWTLKEQQGHPGLKAALKAKTGKILDHVDHLEGEPAVTAACLDNRLYVVNAANGELLSAYYIGEPIWDHAPKGEALLGSPSVIEAGRQTVIVHGSYNGAICILPLLKKCAFRDQSKSLLALWLSLPILLVLFLGVILPILLRIP